MASNRFQNAISRATRSSTRASLTANTKSPLPTPPSPSDSDHLTSPPSSSESEFAADSSDDEAPGTTSKYFPPSSKPRGAGRMPPKREVALSKLLKTKLSPPVKPEREPSPSLGDIPALKSSLPPAAAPGTPPENWERVYALVKQMRHENPAPVDTMGCERLHDVTVPLAVQRFHTLISLMLSSQTKDTVTSVVVRTLQSTLDGGLTVQSIRDLPAPDLDKLIQPVGFHNRKTEYIKKTAEILAAEYDSDIPRTAEGLMALPGVGPKMAYLCLSSAWGDIQGIGVDVHVHRIANLWGWAEGKTPEHTRKQLESWLPKDRWKEVNWLLVGFGQTICLPRGRKCGECKLEKEGLCRAAWTEASQQGKGKGKRKRVVKVVKVVKEEDVKAEEGVKKEESREGVKKEESGEDVTPKKRPRRVVVKTEVKDEYGDVDIEDVPV